MEEMLKDRSGGYTDTDLLPLLQQSEQLLGHYFAQEIDPYHIQTRFALPDSALPLRGNPGMLTKAIMNMLDNAFYAIVRKAKKVSFSPVVTLTANVEGDQYVVKIRDNGIGIEATILNKIFDPFFTTKTTGEAAGVGLYLSREIIQNHGGDISVASVQDEYAEFTIHLPKSTSP
jgi:signal transduction histidine kinase